MTVAARPEDQAALAEAERLLGQPLTRELAMSDAFSDLTIDGRTVFPLYRTGDGAPCATGMRYRVFRLPDGRRILFGIEVPLEGL